jgi:hypothetical protein
MKKPFDDRAKELIGTPYKITRFILWTEGYGSYNEIEEMLESLARELSRRGQL